MSSDARTPAWLARPRPAVSREFLVDAPIRPGQLHGRHGCFVTVRLTSYRSLPLSCLETIDLVIDGAPAAPADIVLILGDVEYRQSDFKNFGSRWWFILDFAELFVPVPLQAGPGRHEVTGTVVTVEPYMTAGRFSFTHTSTRKLGVSDGFRAEASK